MCKFFPDGIDGDECFLSHKKVNNEKTEPKERKTNGKFCNAGIQCQDQSCEQSHWDPSKIVCKFQANCTRLPCLFKHTIERKSFLGVEKRSKKQILKKQILKQKKCKKKHKRPEKRNKNENISKYLV